MTRYTVIECDVESFIAQLQDLIRHGLDPKAKLMAYDPNSDQMEEVTGLVFGDGEEEVQICTDEP
jgi:hypothetical protein